MSQPDVLNPEDATGYFGPDSVTWKLYREPLTLLGGIRALLLQVAHPAVADGVSRYSNFKADPFGRGYRTFKAMARIYFGSKTQALQTAERLRQMHAGIRGEIPDQYTANDLSLSLWVLATLVETTLQVYERATPKHLPENWRSEFYTESKIAAYLLGIPAEVYPPDLAAFRQYFESMLTSDVLGSHPVCKAVAQSIVAHPKAPAKLANLLAVGWLPAPLCLRLGLEVKPDSVEKLNRFIGRFYFFYRCIPGFWRYGPAYHQAKYRIALAGGKRPAFAGIFFNWLGKRFNIPLGLD